MRAVSRAIVGALATLVPATGLAAEARVIVRTYPATLAPTPVDPAPELVTPVVAIPAPPSAGPIRYRAEPMTGTTVAAPAALLTPPPSIAGPVAATPVVALPTPPSARVYRIVRGGRLADVAVKTGVPLDDLVRLNPSIIPAERLSAGMIVVLP